MMFGSVDIAMSIPIVVLLMLVGAAIKHLKFMDKVSNSVIPPVLIVIGVAAAIFVNWPLTHDNLLSTLIEGLASACTAIGLHQAGKNIFVNGVFVNAFSNKYLGSSDTSTDNDNTDDSNTN